MNPSTSFDEVTIVCVTYNSSTLVATMANTLAPFPHVVIIDNGSSDDTAVHIARHIPHARVIIRTTNAGYGSCTDAVRIAAQSRLLHHPR